MPGAPTLPDLDPSALTRAVFQVANELFGPPTQLPSTMPATPTTPTTPPTPTTPTPTTTNPFAVPLRFYALLPDDAVLPGFFDDAEVLRFPLFDAPTGDPAVPWFLPEQERPSVAAPAVVDDVAAHELEPAVVDLPPARGAFDAHAIRREFPILQGRVHGKRLVWLDNAATTQKPREVIDRISTFYERENSNIHRAAHTLAARATDAYESARETTRKFLGASSVKEIVFVRGATEGINLIAQSWGRRNVQAGDEVVVTWLEHHANIVPWQMLCTEKGARLRVAPVDDSGQIILAEYEKLLNPKTRIVALPQVSNALGTVTPAREMIEMAHRHGARVLLDGAQSVSHMRVDVQQLDCDFFVFSGHKVFAPTGIGAVFGKSAILDEMPPWQGGGNMIQDVSFERVVYQPPPARFEAGTGNIADAAGLGAALDWVNRVGLENIERHEHELLNNATEQLTAIPGLRVIGTAKHKAGVLSFILDGHSTADVAAYLDREGVAVRGGHHCAQPILRRFGLESTLARVVRALQRARRRRRPGRCAAQTAGRRSLVPMTRVISPAQLQALLAERADLDIVDVREPSEWRTGHLPGARLLPLDQVRADPKASIPKDNVVFVCAKGARSATAAKLADGLGLLEVFSLEGGTQAWMQAGLPVIVPVPEPKKKASSSSSSSPPDPEIAEPSLDAIVGVNLREQRTRLGLTLDALARQAGVSRALLGQIELGRSVPSIGVVWKLAQALGVPFSLLLSTQDRSGTEILRKARARRLLSADGRFSSRALFPFAGQRSTEFYELWLAPHGREDADAHQPGTRENIVVTAGRLELTLGAEKILLDTGDAVLFSADVPHSYANPDGAECWMNLVMTYAVPVG